MESQISYLTKDITNKTNYFVDIPELFFNVQANEVYHVNVSGTMLLLPEIILSGSGSTTGVTVSENPGGIRFKFVSPDSDLNVQFLGNTLNRDTIKTNEIHENWSNNASTSPVCKVYNNNLNWSFTGLIAPKTSGVVGIKFRCVNNGETAVIKKYSSFLLIKK